MKTLHPGDKHPDVATCRTLLSRCGYWLPGTGDPEWYSGYMVQTVESYQMDSGLTVDGIVGPKTWAKLETERQQSCGEEPITLRDARLSDALWQLWTCDRGQGFRYGAWLSKAIGEAMQSGKRLAYIVPKVVRTDPKMHEPVHGWTCGHWAWLFVSFWLGACKPEVGIYPTYRTGRNGRYIWTLPVVGKWLDRYGRNKGFGKKGTALHRGYSDYLAGTLKAIAGHGLSSLYDVAMPSGFALIEYPSHVATAIWVSTALRIADPRTGLPARPGWYRVAADGSSNPRMEKFTFRRIREDEAGGPRYTAAFFDDPGPDGVMTTGPLAGGVAYPMEVE